MGKAVFYFLAAWAAGALFLSTSCTPAPRASPISQPGPVEAVIPKELEQLSRDVIEAKMERGATTGTVTYRLHEGFFRGQKAYFIRSDASDESFAKGQGLVFAQILEESLDIKSPQGERAIGDIYLFKTGLQGQLPVLSTIPGQPDYTPLFQVHWVTWQSSPAILTSVEAVLDAQRKGNMTAEKIKVVVNYPVVKWPGGEMPHDTKLEPYLGGGQLTSPVDVQRMRVTFKLHQCSPNLLYIVTDTSDPNGAKTMNIVYSPRTALLMKSGPKGAGAALARVFVFGNGPKGDGPMGFQSSMMDPEVKDESWSPLWEHFTVVWKDESKATLLKNLDDFKKRLERGEFQVFNGVPDSHPQGFSVNCPVPAIKR